MRTLIYWLFVTFFRFYSRLFLILVVNTHTRSQGPSIFVANHPNVFDPMYLLSLLGTRVTVLIIKHAFEVPAFGTLLRYTKQIQVTEHGVDAYEEAQKRLGLGESILLFPEGDCNEGKQILPFHTGAVRLAIETRTPIVPIGIYLDPVKIWKRLTRIGSANIIFTWYRYGWYGVTFGEEIVPTGNVRNRLLVLSTTKSLRRKVVSL
jgi:1-acyl-sn-glycerol-3-phosphate acyltransferase